MKFHLISIPLFLLLAQVYSLDNDDKLFRIYIQSARDAELVHHFSLNNVSTVSTIEKSLSKKFFIMHFSSKIFFVQKVA